MFGSTGAIRGCPLGHPAHADPNSCPPPQVLVAQKVTMGVYKGVTTSELDELAAETAASMTATHPDYALVRPHLPTGAILLDRRADALM